MRYSVIQLNLSTTIIKNEYSPLTLKKRLAKRGQNQQKIFILNKEDIFKCFKKNPKINLQLPQSIIFTVGHLL